MSNKNTGILTMEKMDNRLFNTVGSSRIRMRWLLPFWEEAEEYVIGRKYGIMIFQKVYWPEMMDRFKGIKILDLCDPDWLENKPVFEFVDKVDAVTTSTKAIAEYVKKLRPNVLVKCIPDRVYFPEIKVKKENNEDTIKDVVWFGYSGNTHYLVRAFEELIRRGIKLTIISQSDNALDIPLIYREKLVVENVAYDYETLDKEIVKHDALLLPDPYGDEKSKYKSNNKVIHGWALNMPIIKVPEDFDTFLTKESRIVETKKNYEEVQKNWNVKDSVQEYKGILDEIKKMKKK